ncbi:aspartate aminotransferase family protein [Hassallia byssoidea VB512170]|uniref:Aspartate aminotransferase family protein n=1 Tax=Hassallia byssoidea VB512170 TaxID=1304833 RepID=A0A846HGE8_9CYAN|nr:aspartate aminotransferase family protein [Hassalia byssoidea]NEU75710.1 aspartate aminotransferase family protein [Hassalia byssoidea VB512170]
MKSKESNFQETQPQINSIQSPEQISAESPNCRQQKHLETLIARYTKRTKTSKQLTQAYRPVLADPRGLEGFYPLVKEMVYPVIGKHALGSRVWDIDGNEYIDIVMGFGVNLFGHNPPFIKEALEQRLEQGIHFGPQSDLAGEVAELVSELTGMERVTFSNTGTEAVMTAIRLARAATGRYKIVRFSDSYHGHSDGTLVKAEKADGYPHSVPGYPGVPPNVALDVLVLDYVNPQSLEIIKAHEHELAAVIVEPVQSSRPDLQPQEFLQQLRQLTKKSGIVLIFDEVITGFRVHLGGAQAWFDIKADIATYGKIVGGGMPIGIIAGSATYMDKIDGGMWNYGDLSYPQPEAEMTFFSGTFCKHPLAMAAARAVLKRLKSEGPALQEQLNQRTSQFVKTLNTYFEADEIPIRLGNFGSIFNSVRFGNSAYKANSDSLEKMQMINLLLYHHLLDKGVYLRSSLHALSTTHTDEDLDFIIQAIKDSVRELQDGGFLPSPSDKSAKT